jgi:hypothetical protein
MSAAPASGAAPATKATKPETSTTTPPKDQKPAAALEEDDEFEDFPVEGGVSNFSGIQAGLAPELPQRSTSLFSDYLFRHGWRFG